jgi:hypothetical protein
MHASLRTREYRTHHYLGACGLMRGRDEYCPHCDNHFVLEAKTPKASLQVEGEDARIDSRYVAVSCSAETLLRLRRMLKDERMRSEELRTIFDVKEAPNKLG